MKILFFTSGCIPFNSQTLTIRPLGGIETAVIRLAEALTALGHQVIVCTSEENPPLSEPLYLPMRAFGDVGKVDALIAVREWKPAILPIEAKIRMLWTGDSYDQPQNVGIGDFRILEKLDLLLTVSNWQARRLCEESGFPEDRTYTLRNGVHLPYFSQSLVRVRKRLIYSSTPYRGLAHMPKLYLAIKQRHPDAEFHIFSGYGVYAGPQGFERNAQLEFAKLSEILKRLPQATMHGNVRQEQLAQEFQKSAVLAYPNTFEETSCITAMEAQAAGCVPVSSALGALPETIDDAGILLQGTPGTDSYDQAFIDAVDKLFSDDAYFQQLSDRGRERAQEFNWHQIAQQFSDYLLHKLSG